jgi:hypothetical protein
VSSSVRGCTPERTNSGHPQQTGRSAFVSSRRSDEVFGYAATPARPLLIYNGHMVDSFGELEAASLFCPRCKRATPVQKQLLLVLPSGNKYDYTCNVGGTQVGGKTDSDSSDFRRVASAATTPPPPRPGRPSARPPR